MPSGSYDDVAFSQVGLSRCIRNACKQESLRWLEAYLDSSTVLGIDNQSSSAPFRQLCLHCALLLLL
jgi:hypothetical protein